MWSCRRCASLHFGGGGEVHLAPGATRGSVPLSSQLGGVEAEVGKSRSPVRIRIWAGSGAPGPERATSALSPRAARTARPGWHVGGGLPPGSPRPSSWLVPLAPRHPQAAAPRRPTRADARAAGLRRSASFCHLKPLAPAGTLTLSLNPRSLSELSRQGLARPSASNPRRARRPPGTPPGPGDPALHATTSRPRHRHPNFLHVVCAPRLGVRLPC